MRQQGGERPALNLALCGNPNVGKSTVFNALTGLRQHTGNWTGKTVETAEGRVRDGNTEWRLTDLPGTYSLLSGSPEEEVACDFLCFSRLDATVVVCDATCLERNLNVTLQVIEAASRTVVCVNLMDEARRHGVEVNLEKLENALGVPVVGICARNGEGLEGLKARVTETALRKPAKEKALLCYPPLLESAVEALLPALAGLFPGHEGLRFIALRMLAAGDGFLQNRLPPADPMADPLAAEALHKAWAAAREKLAEGGMTREDVVAAVVSASYGAAGRICADVVRQRNALEGRRLRLDRMLCSKRVGIPLMLLMLGLVFYITLSGANVPSAFLSKTLLNFQPTLAAFLRSLGLPEWLNGMLTDGMYRVAAWVVAVMLPPMAIFFPLFTLLEDLGFLPRVAFNLDRFFKGCKACGKQALCMCMGLGCNAVGVTGCRIIQSPRERLIAILTNAFMPCNGRFPTLIAILGMFFVTSAGALGSLLSAALLVGMIVFCVGMTLLCARLLSKTVLKGVPSAFALELPPLRRPMLGQVLVRSVLDRTLFVLGRAVTVAAPAGLVLWVLANVTVEGATLLAHAAGLLDPLGRLMGMDGVILVGFLLGFPANEIVLPIILMAYMAQGALVEPQSLFALKALLTQHGWTLWTAASVMLFSMLHWPCSTTVLTIYKETRSLKWTALAVLLPTALGAGLCMLLSALRLLVG